LATTNELYNAAMKLKDSGQSEAAIEKLGELLAENDTYALAYSALAVLYGKLNQHDKAVANAVRVSELAPEDSFSWTALSVIYQRAFAGTNEQSYVQLAEDAMAKSKSMTGH